MFAVQIKVPYQDDYDALRYDAEEWEGKVISSVSEILKLIN